ncbi:hypothetical protein [Sulfurovum sp. NBC37-1]|uniref:hypothetical protein n=1 Tax=Sulfurovum sp. (strain NBC37-1) TaxID=387093 RepID=UPI0001587AAE|nr:hypothetical protein [Sulfurovum sp. NBC37-1]BAF73022.1 hypothetical protein SUN_2081 [Sulfurovum sp. NBC37-1]
MIHAHRFFFSDQPQLQKVYDSFDFPSPENGSGNRVEVREIGTYEGFKRRSALVYLSERGCYYLSNTPPEKIGKDDDWGLEVENVLSLVWESEHRRILYGKGKAFTPKLLQFWIYHTFFPIVLELERSYKMLHVGAVEIGGGPVFFSAPSFGGKSILTDYFIRQGHTLYADDTLPVREENGKYIAYPSFPYHRPYRQPETLGHRAENFARKPAPIKALFELEPAEPDAPVEITVPKGIGRFKAFLYSSFLKFTFMKKERFNFFTQMAMQVPVYRVLVPWDKERLPEVYEAIVKKSREL